MAAVPVAPKALNYPSSGIFEHAGIYSQVSKRKYAMASFYFQNKACGQTLGRDQYVISTQEGQLQK